MNESRCDGAGPTEVHLTPHPLMYLFFYSIPVLGLAGELQESVAKIWGDHHDFHLKI